MIDYWDETLQSVTMGEEENANRKKRHSTGSSIPLKAKNQIAHEMDVLTDVIEWIEKKRWSPQQPQDIWVTPEKLEMGQIKSQDDDGVCLYSRGKRNPLVWGWLRLGYLFE